MRARIELASQRHVNALTLFRMGIEPIKLERAYRQGMTPYSLQYSNPLATVAV